MCNFKLSGAAVPVHIDGPYTVKPQEHHVHEVFLGKHFRVKMSVHQPKTAKTPSAAPALGQIGYVERARSSDEHRFDAAVAAYEQSYLTSGFKRQVCQIAGQFR